VCVFKYIGCNVGLVTELLQVPPGIVILSRVDNLASFSGFEVIILMFLGLLGNLFRIKCELPDRLSDPVAAMYRSPIAFFSQRLLLVLQPKTVWVIICVKNNFI
jgi:hypothetical protein